MAHEEDNIDTSTLAIVGVISSALSFALIFLLMVLYHSFVNKQESAENRKPHEEAERLLAQQQAVLNEAGWVNETTGQVRIPVSQAMPLVVAQLKATPEDAGVAPPQFAEADATILNPGTVEESKPADEPKAETKPAAEPTAEPAKPADPKPEAAPEGKSETAKPEEATKPASEEKKPAEEAPAESKPAPEEPAKEEPAEATPTEEKPAEPAEEAKSAEAAAE